MTRALPQLARGLSRAAVTATRRVVLIDDLLATGAAVETATGPLRADRATEVDVLTLARVTSRGDRCKECIFM